MSRWNAYLDTSTNIVKDYDGHIPLPVWLKGFFRIHKKMGSTDRKVIADMVYNFYRLGHAFKELPAEERILTALFLCKSVFNDTLNIFKPLWNDAIHMSLNEKLEILGSGKTCLDLIFPWRHDLSNGIDAELFSQSLLVQPELFLRIRPGKEAAVVSKLSSARVGFKRLSGTCIELPNSTSVNSMLQLDEEAVVQDFNSQQTGAFIVPGPSQVSLWDCCAASGGKAIMTSDLYPHLHLTVSDIRESIMHNLHQRFKRASISNYSSFVTDLTQTKYLRKKDKFDIILADLPCTGSGTWARTPEQLYFFDPAKIEYYSGLQKRIISNVIPQLKKTGKLVYITCSVFEKENEEVVEFVQQQFHLALKEIQVLKGYDIKADSMFVAVFEV